MSWLLQTTSRGGRPDGLAVAVVLSKKKPALIERLLKTLEWATAGDLMSSKKWSRKSTRTVAKALGVSHTKARALMRANDFRLRVNRKRLTGRASPEREQQFTKIGTLIAQF